LYVPHWEQMSGVMPLSFQYNQRHFGIISDYAND